MGLTMSAEPDEFAELMARARDGDTAAQARLCEQYEAKVQIVARVLLGPVLRQHFDSLDLVQSVHRSLLVGIRGQKFDISTPDKLVALATTMLRRKVARKWRLVRRQVRLETPSAAPTDLAQTLHSLAHPADDPAHAAQLNDEIQFLCRHLDDTERQILEQRAEGYSTAEIAEQLGLNHVTLRVRMTRLRERLRANGVLNEWL